MEQLILEIQKMQQGNFQDYESFYALSADYIYYLIKNTIADDTIAQSILTDTYNQIYSEIGGLNAPEYFYSWAGQIVTSKMTAYMRLNNALVNTAEEESGDFPFEVMADDKEAFVPENILERVEYLHIIQEMIDSLPVEQKLAMQFFYLEEEGGVLRQYSKHNFV